MHTHAARAFIQSKRQCGCSRGLGFDLFTASSPASHRPHQAPGSLLISPEVIRLVVMMCVRYPLSLRDVEDLLTERGIDISHETGLRIHISRPDGESARCSASRARAQPKSFSQPTPPLTTFSMSNAISRRPCDATRLDLDVLVTGMRKTLLARRMDYPMAIDSTRAQDQHLGQAR
jgi:hypothetical protein